MRPETEPNEVHADLDKNSVTLYFDGDDADFYMRGAICWPIEWPDGNDTEITGHVLLAGMDIDTKDITVFQEKQFVTVSNIINDGKIEYHGLESFFTGAWSKYFLRDYYWHGNEVTTKQWRLETIRNDLIKPKPYFLKVDWSEDDQAAMQMWHEFKVGKINLKPLGRESVVYRHLMRVKTGEKIVLPAVHALITLIAGFKKYPWRG